MVSRNMNRVVIAVTLFLITSAISVGAIFSMRSDDLEEAVERALIPSVTEGRDKVEAIAKDWMIHFITPAYHPPTAVRFVAIPRRNARECDFVRLSYAAGGVIVTVTQTTCLFSIELEGDRWSKDGKRDLAELEELARALLNGADTLDLTVDERDRADVEQGGATLPDADRTKFPWLVGLKWRKDGDRVVFWWVKYENETKARRTASLRDNSRWFSPPDEN